MGCCKVSGGVEIQRGLGRGGQCSTGDRSCYAADACPGGTELPPERSSLFFCILEHFYSVVHLKRCAVHSSSHPNHTHTRARARAHSCIWSDVVCVSKRSCCCYVLGGDPGRPTGETRETRCPGLCIAGTERYSRRRER